MNLELLNRWKGAGIVRPAAPKVALGFCYGTLHPPFVFSKDRMWMYDSARSDRGLKPMLTHQLPQGGLYIDHNRNIIVQRFRDKTNADWLLMIDTDIEFPANLVEQLLAVAGDDCKIVAASVPLPMDDAIHSCGYVFTSTPGIWANVPIAEIKPTGTDCDGIATAVSMIHREVLDAIADRDGQVWFLKTTQPNLIEERSAAAWRGEGPIRDRQVIPMGEDLAFSLRAHLAGYKCRVARLRGLRHHKNGPLTHDHDFPEEQLEVAG